MRHAIEPPSDSSRPEPSTASRSNPHAPVLAQGLVGVFVAGLIAAFVAGSLGQSDSMVGTWMPLFVATAGAASCATRAITVQRDRGAWSVLAAAIGIWTVGSAFAALQIRSGVAVQHPNLSDACHVAFYPLAYLGMVQLIRGRVTRFAAALWLDGLIGAAAVGAIATGVLLPSSTDAAADLTPFILKLILPLGDMLLLAFVAGVMALNGWRPGRAWVVLGAAFGISAFAHSLELSFTQGATSGVTDLLWPLGLALIGFAAWRPSALRPHIRLEGWSLLVAPTLFGWITVALVGYGNFTRLGPFGLALAGVTLLLVMVRTGLTFKENAAIAAELRQGVADSARDALTGLPNHRAFHEILPREVSLAIRHDRELSIAVFDIDEFRLINQARGHRVGDEVLKNVAQRIAETMRSEDVLARVGGEKFACVFPSTGGDAAWRAAERARRTVEAELMPVVGEVTVSVGVCDLATAGDADELMRLADGALYWAKMHGRNVTYRYTPEVMDVLSAEERAEHAERSRTLSAITALARAVDAKDAYTQRHSERVGDVAVEIAQALGWSKERRVQLREAGLVHDVGKIGVPDAVLLKPGRLTNTERDIIETHAPLGAQIVQDVLGAEQVLWVLHHHERWDGAGYPRGLVGGQIPEGAQILAVADAWDAMTANRPYRNALAAEAVIDELLRGAGIQWSPRAVDAIVDLWKAGVVVSSSAVVTHETTLPPLNTATEDADDLVPDEASMPA